MIILNFAKMDGLVPAVVQDYKTNEVLMVAFINEEAWQKTLDTGKAHYYTRTRQKIWLKGETSGHFQLIKEILVDCDDDTVVFRVEQVGGAACHTGYNSCFYRRVEENELVVIKEMAFDPQQVYSN
ncbi:MAG: phosphoribosyl-AMP cyclohydrolase [bacterium]